MMSGPEKVNAGIALTMPAFWKTNPGQGLRHDGITFQRPAAIVKPLALFGAINMAEYQVTCIRRDGADQDRRIDRLGGPNWNDTIDNVIRFIETNAHSFFVSIGQGRAYLEVKVHPVSRRKYLRTIPDGRWDNNLYALPECR